MKKYIYIQCFEREICTPEIFDTHEQAMLAMHKDFLENLDESDIEYELENEGVDLRNITKCLLSWIGCGDFDFAPDIAWVNGRQGNWDARICEIEV